MQVAAHRGAAVARHVAQVILLGAAFAGAARADGVVSVSLPWVRVAPGGGAGEVFMEITSSAGATLVAVGSRDARKVTLLGPGTPRKAVKSIDLPAGTAVALVPKGYRVALEGLKGPLRQGDHVALDLVVVDSDGTRRELATRAEVRRRSAKDDEMTPHAHAHAASDPHPH